MKIMPFAEYGFNKSHAAAYAIIAYQTAFLKTYFPNEFFSASMTMDISNQNKLGEFYEELLRLNINIERPNINKCFSDFKSDNDNFYYALGGVKAVGIESISNIINERNLNGEFKSINDFIRRVNPKDINKLQLEGLVKSGAFDEIHQNRKAIYDSIPNLILKSKNFHENKSVNQIDLFELDKSEEDDIILKCEDWSFDEKLSKEFEAVGFYISDHPLNQYKDIFSDYKIIDYNNFIKKEDNIESNIAATLLKVQERKTQKGNSYAIIKLSDLSGVFELFIFSEILELNRDKLKEGSSLLITASKNSSNDDNRFKRINVKKIVSLNEIFNKPISKIEITTDDLSKIKELSNFFKKEGSTEVKINIQQKNKQFVFKLKNKRLVDRNLLKTLKNEHISSIIN